MTRNMAAAAIKKGRSSADKNYLEGWEAGFRAGLESGYEKGECKTWDEA
ncbi:MAG: hypothetical protein M3261_00005 [Thermoproteota archaeon]|nr:hypothetical protein [Thermoproteota archaeon]